MSWLVVLISLILLRPQVAVHGLYTTQDVLEILSNVCPYSNICNRTSNQDFKWDTDKYTPCCQSCSCDFDCAARRDCCIASMLETLEKADEEKCVNSKGEIGIDDAVLGYAYLLIDTCPRLTTGDSSVDTSVLLNNSTEIVSCRSESFSPVSSKTTRRIYYNSLCAECNEQKQAVPWQMIIPQMGPLTSYELAVMTNEDIDKAFPRRLYTPPEGEDWTSKECVSVVGSCNSSNTTLQTLCKTYYAPIKRVSSHTRRPYKNVFCAMCNGLNEERLLDNSVCIRSDTRTKSLTNTGTIIDVLHYNKRQTGSNKHTSKPEKSCSDHEITQPNMSTCYPVFCPRGMYRTDSHQCVYYGKRWVINPKLMLTLMKDSGPSLDLALSKMKPLQLVKLLQIPKQCHDIEWTDIYILGDIIPKTVEQHPETFEVVLLKNTDGFGISPEIFFPNAKSCLTGNWAMVEQKQKFVLKAFLNKQRTLVIDQNAMPRDRILYDILDKLYFCEQIYLPKDEVMKTPQGLIINSTGAFLYPSEFSSLTRLRSEDRILYVDLVAVCVDDFIETSPDILNSGGHIEFCLSQYCCLLLCVIIFMQRVT
ncbi:hypothetical protein MAR_014597 [Mya arenaria]|uniref:Uncharacterized protein n=1 Tax=Mya arenaria TaxID=6604 RepID=A0ABY7G367_MYAAR|nr:hypothetical protein MAR_014597 [Mya arenaria]